MNRGIYGFVFGLVLCAGCASFHVSKPTQQASPYQHLRMAVDRERVVVSGDDWNGDANSRFQKALFCSLSTISATNSHPSSAKGENILTCHTIITREQPVSTMGLLAFTLLPYMPYIDSRVVLDFTTIFTVTNTLTDVKYSDSVHPSIYGKYSGWSVFRRAAYKKLIDHSMDLAPQHIAYSIASHMQTTGGWALYEKANRARLDLLALQAEARAELVKANAGDAVAQYNMGLRYLSGVGVDVDLNKSFFWFKKAAEQGKSIAQHAVALCYANGNGISRNMSEAVRWCEKSAEQGYIRGQYTLGNYYLNGEGVIRDPGMAYRWLLLASAWGGESLRPLLERVESSVSSSEANEARTWATNWRPQQNGRSSKSDTISEEAMSSGTGFFVSTNGYLVTANHVVAGARRITVRYGEENLLAKVIASDPANDVAILRISDNTNRQFPALYLPLNPCARLGERVFTIGFPLPTLQGINPKLSKGDVCAMTGMRDDPRHLQISIPVQAGNSGGVLANEKGEVVGIIVSKLNALVVEGMTGDLVQNVNYAVKGSYVRTLAESVSGLSGALASPLPQSNSIEEVYNLAKGCSVLIKAESQADPAK